MGRRVIPPSGGRDFHPRQNDGVGYWWRRGQFRFIKVLQAIHGVDESAGMAWLSINGDALELVDLGEKLWLTLAEWGKGGGQFLCTIRLTLLGGVLVVFMTWARPSVVWRRWVL